MKIRPAEDKDKDGIIEMALLIHLESNYRNMTFDVDKVSALIDFIIQGDKRSLFGMVVEDVKGSLIGMMGGYCQPHWFSSEKVCCDYLIYVRPKHRGGPAAAMLVSAYKLWAKSTGAKMIMVGTTTGIRTEDATLFYDRMGFERCGIVMKLKEVD